MSKPNQVVNRLAHPLLVARGARLLNPGFDDFNKVSEAVSNKVCGLLQ